jgi:hypothetical protein
MPFSKKGCFRISFLKVEGRIRGIFNKFDRKRRSVLAANFGEAGLTKEGRKAFLSATCKDGLSVRDLFEEIQNDEVLIERIGDCAFVPRGFALPLVDQLLPALERIQTLSPFRHMITPGGFKMSVALTNCDRFGWITDRRGYRYTRVDPETCQPWPCMPDVLMTLVNLRH